jgi:hypothetical protein
VIVGRARAGARHGLYRGLQDDQPAGGRCQGSQLVQRRRIVLEVVEHTAEQHEIERLIGHEVEERLLTELDIEPEHVAAEGRLLDE